MEYDLDIINTVIEKYNSKVSMIKISIFMGIDKNTL